ncbi:MAG: TetR/AcrR family transcriptional regulator [Pseudomonadota bacterium]
MNEASTIVRTGRKFDQVLEGARKVFMSDGFEGASVDDIAKAAGVSKATLYSYFPDKKLLFIEMARVECGRMAEQTLGMMDINAPVRDAMKVAANQVINFLTSRFALQVFRICVAESNRFPELGRAFYENGPKRGRREIIEYFAIKVAHGELKIPDFEMAADQFSELCKSRLWNKAVFGIQSEFTEFERRQVAEEAVETFLARYGA